MAEVKKAVGKVAEKKVKEAAADVKKASVAVKTVAEKKTEAAKPAAKKAAAAPKAVAEPKAAAPKATAAPKAAAAPKKAATPKKAASEQVQASVAVVLQYAGKEVVYAELVKRAEEAWKATGKAASGLKDVKVYVKPEENKAYYVLNNGEEIGSFDI
jgi:hypothetical protein